MVASYLYVPNLIGYVRVIAMLLSYAHAQDDWYFSMQCYVLSQALDAVDGWAARQLNQSSELGRVLDMVTDRVSTTGLCVVLAQIYPQRLGAFCALICLDLFSHWYHMHATLVGGAQSHKGSSNWIVRLYYNRVRRSAPSPPARSPRLQSSARAQPILFTVCAGNELWFVSLYAMHHLAASGGGYVLPVLQMPLFQAGFYLATPFFAFKQFTNFAQLLTACGSIVELDAQRAAQCSAAAAKRM